MNRIVIGSGNDPNKIMDKYKIVVNIKNDTNILIKDDSINKYVINVFDSNVNIFCNSEFKKNVSYEININKGHVSFNSITYALGDVLLDVNLNKETSSILICNSVIAKTSVKHKINIMHNAKNTNSDVKNNGITKDNGSICFDVVSVCPKRSKNCIINQDSKIISFNGSNENKINPVLLIDEFETEAKHAAFIGNFNFNDMFYLMTRGLNKKQAKELLTEGLLIGTLDLCFEEKEILKKKLSDEWR